MMQAEGNIRIEKAINAVRIDLVSSRTHCSLPHRVLTGMLTDQ
jgi:hypothetical protein